LILPQAEQRPAPAGPHVLPRHQDALDGLRAVAAAAVLLTHVGGLTGYVFTGTPASWVISRGDVGVPVFFALSGLLLYRPWASAVLTGQPASRVLLYLRRRALRILPAYWAVVLIALPVLNPHAARHAWSWLQYLLLVQNYDPHPWWTGTGATGLAQMWSLAVEVSFYLVLPLLAAALAWLAHTRLGQTRLALSHRRATAPASPADLARRARRMLTIIAILAASSFGWTVLAYYPRPQLWFAGTLPPLLIWFAAGMAIAVISAWAAAEPEGTGPASRFCRSVADSSGMCWLIAGCAFALACTPLTGPEFGGVPSLWNTEFKTALYTIIALAAVAPLAFQPWRAQPTLTSRVLSSRGFRFLGKISYGIFLWQFLAAYAFFALLHLNTAFYGGSYSTVAAVGVLLGVTVFTIAFSVASYYLLERPAQRFRGRGGPAPRSAGPR
jgi:peptidoglycan/LPS O-acetylase OafA/YrhL